MRYVIAIATAIVFALLATIFGSGPLASRLMSGMRFDNPDDVAFMHAVLFMAFNGAALVAGFTVGMLLSRRRDDDDN